ncbi:MAG: hypothetical protein L6Q54_04770 [Leptospiraceae bacterium]|nr:hypothetical protein [Leptospiraceae bacterium]MCK6380549.1 hypothetical protein [Leptospiraceae bacterium]NUM41800.1 hypothetical protein [Leptospiraceae bacterium]
MSKFFIAFIILFVFSCKDGKESGFLGVKTPILDWLQNTAGHPGYIEKKSIILGLVDRIKKENYSLQEYLRGRLIFEGVLQAILSGNKEASRQWTQELESIQNLGGLRIGKKGEVIFSFGDWTDLYSDGYSKTKLKKSLLIQKIQTDEENEVTFFIRNRSGYFPVDFSYIGFEGEFFLFQGDGSLRYAKSDSVDYSIRHEKFRENFSDIKKSHPNSEVYIYEDLTLYYIPGKTPLSFYIFLLLKIAILFSFFIFCIFGYKEVKQSIEKYRLEEKERSHKVSLFQQNSSTSEFRLPLLEKKEIKKDSSYSIEAEKESDKKLEDGKKDSVDRFITELVAKQENTKLTLAEKGMKYSKIEKIE